MKAWDWLRKRLPKRRAKASEPDSLAGHALIAAAARADRFSAQDLIVEASYGIGARPTRLIMTTMGTVLGIASLVVTIGFAQTAAAQIAKQFDAVEATQVTIEPGVRETATGEVAATQLPWDSAERVERLVGVSAAGLIADVSVSEVTAVPVNDPSAPPGAKISVLATSPDLLTAVRGTVVTGRYFDAFHDEQSARVTVLGARAAEKLGVNRVDRQPSVFIDGVTYSVIGIIDGVERRSDLLDSAIIPVGAARTDFNLEAADELQIQIKLGAGPLVARQAPIALDPEKPDDFEVQAPPKRSELRDNVQADINVVFIVLGVIALLAGGLGIANVTMLSVLERVGEIGLRRALGATRKQIAGQFMVESVVIGLLGGLIGAALGVFTIVVISLIQQWTPVIDPFLAVGSALLGAVVGLIAGSYPAARASRIEPISALRSA